MWTPQVFWSSTYWEYSNALVGYMKFHRMGKWGENSIAHWSHDDYLAAKEEIAEALKQNVQVKDVNTPDNVKARLKAAKAKRRSGRKSS